MRVTTLFNRILGLPGVWVCSVAFTDQGLVLGLRRRRGRRYRCPCGYSTQARYDLARRRWRHLDFGATKVWLEADIARVDCPSCGVRTELVSWARPGARHTRDFQIVSCWLAQRMDKTSVARLLRCSWEAVDHAVKQVVADQLDQPGQGPQAPSGAGARLDRLDGLRRVGVDEISHKRGHSYLTIVCDHDTGRVVWIADGRTREAFESFFVALGPQRAAQLEAITMDASTIYAPVAAEQAPQATLCLDPFHIIKWANDTLDRVYKTSPPPKPPAKPANPAGKTRKTRKTGKAKPVKKAKQSPYAVTRSWRRLRGALRAAKQNLDTDRRKLINSLRRHRYMLWRAWELKEKLRDLYRKTSPRRARTYLKNWITQALRSRIGPFHTLALQLRRHFDAIAAAVEHGLSNSRAEGINTKIRVIQRHGYGLTPGSLTAMIWLCLGGIHINLPTQT